MNAAHAGRPGAQDGTLLIVEDDVDVQETVRDILERDGFAVTTADSVRAAEAVLGESDVMLAVIDLTLRDGNGLELVRRLSLNPRIGTIILSGAAEDMDRIIGLEVGADDYVTKPFNPREFAARVRRHADRLRYIRAGAAGAPEPVEEVEGEANMLGPWHIDEARRAVYDPAGARAELSDAEFRTLLTLFRNQGAVLTRDELYRSVVGPGSRDPLDRRIDVYVAGLRKKLALSEPHKIRTVHGVGYILD